MVLIMNIKMDKIEELLSTLKKKEDEKQKNTVLWVLAIIGAVAAIAGIAFAVYRFFAPEMAAMGLVVYGIVAAMQYRKIKKIPMDQALKNVE